MRGQLKCNQGLLPPLSARVLCLADSSSEQGACLPQALQRLFILPQSRSDPSSLGQKAESLLRVEQEKTGVDGLPTAVFPCPQVVSPGDSRPSNSFSAAGLALAKSGRTILRLDSQATAPAPLVHRCIRTCCISIYSLHSAGTFEHVTPAAHPKYPSQCLHVHTIPTPSWRPRSRPADHTGHLPVESPQSHCIDQQASEALGAHEGSFRFPMPQAHCTCLFGTCGTWDPLKRTKCLSLPPAVLSTSHISSFCGFLPKQTLKQKQL